MMMTIKRNSSAQQTKTTLLSYHCLSELYLFQTMAFVNIFKRDENNLEKFNNKQY